METVEIILDGIQLSQQTKVTNNGLRIILQLIINEFLYIKEESLCPQSWFLLRASLLVKKGSGKKEGRVNGSMYLRPPQHCSCPGSHCLLSFSPSPRDSSFLCPPSAH